MTSIVYFIAGHAKHLDGQFAIKIGYSAHFKNRQSNLKAFYGEHEVLGVTIGGKELEGELHSRFAQFSFANDGSLKHKEWFYDNPEIREYIAENCHGRIPGYDRRNAVIVSDKTKTAINILTGSLSLGGWRKLSQDKAIWLLIETHYPDIAKEAERLNNPAPAAPVGSTQEE